jgi:hypothetical protein
MTHWKDSLYCWIHNNGTIPSFVSPGTSLTFSVEKVPGGYMEQWDADTNLWVVETAHGGDDEYILMAEEEDIEDVVAMLKWHHDLERLPTHWRIDEDLDWLDRQTLAEEYLKGVW